MAIRLSTNRLDLDSANLQSAEMRAWSETVNPLGSVSGATTINLALGNVVTATVTGAVTWTVTNASSTNTSSFTLILVAGGSAAQTWMSGTAWPGGTPPTLSATGTNVITFFSTDAGTTWRGTMGGQTQDQFGAKLFVWGNGAFGHHGLGDTINRSSPTQLAGRWSKLRAAGYCFQAIRPDGSLYVWGGSYPHTQGLGDTIIRSSPVQLPGTWTDITDSYGGAGSFKADGSFWVRTSVVSGWSNSPLGETIARSSPVQLAGTWSGLGWFSRYGGSAMRSDGSLWMWGTGFSPAWIGDGNTIARSSPVQIAGTWSGFNRIGSPFVNANAGIKHDGSLWTWGVASSGMLGIGATDAGNRSSPVQVAGTWKAVAHSGEVHAHAIRHDGTLWSWGANSGGRLGLGDTIYRSSPVQVGTGTWSKVVVGRLNTFALKADGSLFAWGSSTSGVLGLDDVVTRSSPVQIPGTWLDIDGGYPDVAGGLKL